MIQIFYEDAHICVCRKPAGVHSQLSQDGNNMIALLTAQGRTEIYPVHRLDKQTTGLMVYAKTQSAAAALSRQIAENKVQKEYAALVHGILEPQTGVWEDLLYHDKQKNKSYTVKKERKGVKKAKLAYQGISAMQTVHGELTFVRVTLFTGRTHQIRVQFASRGYSLAGDAKYGANDGLKDLCLACVRLAFVHPVTHKPMEFSEQDITPHSLFPGIQTVENPL